MAYLVPESEFLEHHGIIGMHWGKRNGPPYPLSPDISTGNRLKPKKLTPRENFTHYNEEEVRIN